MLRALGFVLTRMSRSTAKPNMSGASEEAWADYYFSSQFALSTFNGGQDKTKCLMVFDCDL